MKLSTYSAGGSESWGVVVDGGIVDIPSRTGGKYPTLRDAIAADAMAEVASAADGQAADHAMDAVTLQPVIPNPDKIICIGLNYRTHVLEGGRDIPDHPMIFTRYPSSQVGHDVPLVRPKASDKFDFEGELAVIIGKGGRHVSEADALSIIAGYSCYNDGSIRDFQRHTSQFIPGKNFDKSGSFGPWMVTADEIPAPDTMTLITRLNGEVMQEATTDDLLFNIPQLIAYITTWTELLPGDVISTGTTGGVGFYRDPQVFMKPGDTIEVDLSAIGVLKNGIVDEA